MQSINQRKEIALELATTRLGYVPHSFERPFTVLASPAWRGVEGDIWVAQCLEAAEVYKHYHADTSFYVDMRGAIQIASIAGELGVAPKVLATWPEQGVLAMEFLGHGWRAGGLHDAALPDIRRAIVKAKKTIQAGPRFPRDGDIFNDINGLVEYCRKHRAVMPSAIDAFQVFVNHASQAIRAAGADRVPCHRDGNTSNLMIGPSNSVMLLDFDMSANADPLEDVGCHLMELYEREPEAREGYEEWMGSFDESLFQRAMVYGILDDLRWALVAAAMAASSDRKALEFSKYASWRFLRFEQNSQKATAFDRIRCIAK